MTKRLVGIWLLSGLVIATAGCPADPDDDTEAPSDDDSGDDDAVDDDSGDDDVQVDDPCDEAEPGDPCCAEPGPVFYLCFDLTWPGVEPVTGYFTDWGDYGYADIQFVASDGSAHNVWVEGSVEALDLVPDLAAAGEVTVVQTGGCDGKGGFYAAVLVYRGEYPGELVLLTGSAAANGPGGWTVEVGPDTDTCPARPGDMCNEYLHNRPVALARGDESWSLYQGESATAMDVAMRIGLAQSGSGEYLCVDGGGTEYNSWMITPIDTR